jgi:G:T/U-mismatch repair DNA glycosylase
MPIIKHLTSNYSVHRDTEILLVGTFNPDIPNNSADFFYGRARNHLWTLLPSVYKLPSLKKATKEEKIIFIRQYHIDFTDLIDTVDVEEVDNYDDIYLDDKVVLWNNVIGIIQSLPKIKKVAITRKTLNQIPHMAERIKMIQKYCNLHDIKFTMLHSPARYYSQTKQQMWNAFFLT